MYLKPFKFENHKLKSAVVCFQNHMFNNPVQVESDAKAAAPKESVPPVATPARAATPCPSALAANMRNCATEVSCFAYCVF